MLLETCLEESPNIIQAAYDAINENNFEVARRSGHSLKSSFAAVGAMSASAISKELEFIEKDDPDSFRNQLQQIEAAFNLLSEQARQSV